jgi:hypothetical protein
VSSRSVASFIYTTCHFSPLELYLLFDKDLASVPDSATMAYFFKPLTYNSQVAGYLLRSYPNNWITMDATTKKVLQSVGDGQILFAGTNTPDLRAAVRMVQKSVDERAIKAMRK